MKIYKPALQKNRTDRINTAILPMHNWTKLVYFGIALYLVFGVFSRPLPVFAESETVVVEPAKMDIQIWPGQKVKKTFVIVNRSNLPIKLKTSISDFKTIGEEGKIELYNKEQEGAAGWLIPQYLVIGLKPLESKSFDFYVSIPENFSAGGHFGAITLSPTNESLKFNSSLGILINLTVAGKDATSGGKVIDFSTSGFQKGEPVSFNLKLENLGNTLLRTKGFISIKNWQGKEIRRFNIGNIAVYPEETRSFQWQWNNTPWLGVYKAELNLENVNALEQKFTEAKQFAIFPWQFALPVLLLGMISVLFLYFTRNSRGKLIPVITTRLRLRSLQNSVVRNKNSRKLRELKADSPGLEFKQKQL